MITKLQAHKSASRRLVPSRRSDPEHEQQLSDGSQMQAQAGGDRIGEARQLPPRSRRVERPPKGQGSAGDGRGTHREGVDVVVVEAVAPVLPDQIFLTDASERLCTAEIEEGRGLTHGIHFAWWKLVVGGWQVGTEARRR